jgi:hypothetical protein
LTWEEFEDLTPTGFYELSKRRNVRIKYERYAAAQAAAAVYNVNRQRTEDPIVTAMDFVRTEEQSEKRERLLKAKRYVTRALGTLPMNTAFTRYLEVRSNVIKDLKADGYENAEQIVNDLFPSLGPKEQSR